MSEKLLISVANNDIRVGVVANGLLQEVFIERSGRKSTVGNITKAKSFASYRVYRAPL